MKFIKCDKTKVRHQPKVFATLDEVHGNYINEAFNDSKMATTSKGWSYAAFKRGVSLDRLKAFVGDRIFHHSERMDGPLPRKHPVWNLV